MSFRVMTPLTTRKGLQKYQYRRNSNSQHAVGISNQMLLKRENPLPAILQLSPDADNHESIDKIYQICLEYVNVLRPITIIQAVGALLVGYLAILSNNHTKYGLIKPIRAIAASLSVYLSYGCGMLMNDLVDIESDSLHDDKKDRAIASGRISKRAGWMYSGILVAISLMLGRIFVGYSFTWWLAGNIGIMLFYALGLQKIFLLKNILCGWLAISPLLGASLMAVQHPSGIKIATAECSKLIRLAAVGFPMQVSREILKDIEDVEVDLGKKTTLPNVIGSQASHTVAYTIVGMNTCSIIFTPTYWKLFASWIPIFPIGVTVGSIMCIKAATLPLKEGQRLLKRSIFVLLLAMIGALILQ